MRRRVVGERAGDDVGRVAVEQEADDVAVEFGEDLWAEGRAASDEFEDEVAAVAGLDEVAVCALEFVGDGVSLRLRAVFYELERGILVSVP